MRKSAFAFLVIIILATGTYVLQEGRGGGTGVESQEAEGIIQVTGLVERPYNVTPEGLRNMTPGVIYADLYCVDSPNLPRKSGTWIGVPLKALLERAGVKEGAYKIAFYAEDGYTTDLYVEDVMNNGSIIIAYEFNGKPIKPRLVVPGRWGYKWIKGLTEVKLVDYNFRGTWESAGYPDDAYIGGSAQRGVN